MKKHILVILSMLIFSTGLACVEAKTVSNPTVNSAIKMYKAQNYSQCYNTLSDVVQRDPSNVLAYYYLAMSAAQIGKRKEAIENYSRVLTLSSDPQLSRYAEKGKRCLETPEMCHEESVETELDKFIQGSYGNGFSETVQSQYEKMQIDSLKREINNNKDIEPQKFKDYKDFSSQAPTNDEIVNALRTLQRAGLSDVNNFSELSLLNNSRGNSDMLLNMFSAKDAAAFSPQLIQSLLTNQMGF